MRSALGLWFFLGFMLPASAQACIVSDGFRALIHDSLPKNLHSEWVVLDIKILTRDPSLLYKAGLRARVKRVVQGPAMSEFVLLRQTEMTSCDVPFDNGRSGLVVGYPRATENGVVVFDPVLVSRDENHRLPERFGAPVRDLQAAWIQCRAKAEAYINSAYWKDQQAQAAAKGLFIVAPTCPPPPPR